MRAPDGVVYFSRRPGVQLVPECTVGPVKHSGGYIMIRDRVTGNGVGRLYNVNGAMKADQYQEILQNSMQPSMVDVLRGLDGVFARAHTAKA